MAFTVTTMTYEERKTKIDRMKIYVDELQAINEAARKLEASLLNAGISGAETKSTVDKALSAGGPPYKTADTDIDLATGDTVSDRLVNILTTNTGFTGWNLTTPT